MSDPGVEYREAKAAVAAHLRVWADAGLARAAWLKAHRGVPAHVLYDAKTGEPRDPELAALERAEADAQAGYWWCKALVVACGEVVKGSSFDEVVAAQAPRPSVKEVLEKVEG